MSKSRLEAFSDGVIAILITIMVLELHVPEGVDLAALSDLTPIFLSYVLSFVFSRHLLEQPSPFIAARKTCKWKRALGKLASLILAISHSLCNRLDGRELFCAATDRTVWRCLVDVWTGLLHSRAEVDLTAWQ